MISMEQFKIVVRDKKKWPRSMYELFVTLFLKGQL